MQTIDKHCANCSHWDCGGKQTRLEGQCSLHDCTFLVNGCDDFEPDEDRQSELDHEIEAERLAGS